MANCARPQLCRRVYRTHRAEEWHTASVVVDGSHFAHYVDGVLETSPPVPHAAHELPHPWIPLGPGSMSLGMRINNVSWFRGAIRAVRFTPLALSSCELLPPDRPADIFRHVDRPLTVSGGEAVATDSIRQLLQTTVAAWNAGDLGGFMTGYWESDDLVFTSGGNVRRGYAATADNYWHSYGADDGTTNAATMGTIDLVEVEIHEMNKDAAWVLGRVVHTIQGVPQAVRFTLGAPP